jgi:hypothetical protein
VSDHCLSEQVVATIEALSNGLHKILYPSVQRFLEFLLSHVHDGTLHELRNLVTKVPIHQDHPLIDHELLSFELNLNSLKHFDSLKNVLQAVWIECHSGEIMYHHEAFHGPFDSHSEIDTIDY